MQLGEIRGQGGIVIPEDFRAAGQDAQAEAGDDGVPKEELTLIRGHTRAAHDRLGQLPGHLGLLPPTAHRQHAPPQFLQWRSAVQYGDVWQQIKANRALVPHFAWRDAAAQGPAEHDLAKVGVEGSNPFARSKNSPNPAAQFSVRATLRFPQRMMYARFL